MSSRLLTDGIAKSRKLPELTPDALNLFFLLVPHFSVHGKMSGDPYFIKGIVCPRFERFTLQKIEKALTEISEKTNVKWFQVDDLWYLHSLNYQDHQPGLRKNRSGADSLPDYKGSNNIPKPILKPKDKPKAEVVELPKWMPVERWRDFLAMRKKNKSEASLLAQKLLITSLGKLKDEGEDPTEVIERAIMNGWKGFYGKNNKGGQGGKPNKEKFKGLKGKDYSKGVF